MLAQKQESHGTGLFRTGDGVDAVVLGVAQTETLTETSGPACKVADGEWTWRTSLSELVWEGAAPLPLC